MRTLPIYRVSKGNNNNASKRQKFFVLFTLKRLLPHLALCAKIVSHYVREMCHVSGEVGSSEKEKVQHYGRVVHISYPLEELTKAMANIGHELTYSSMICISRNYASVAKRLQDVVLATHKVGQ